MSLENTATAPLAVTHEELVDKARGLVPYLRDHAAATESARDMSSEALEMIMETGIPRCLTPRRWGGYELGFRTLCETTSELAKGCASTAWCTGFLSAHTWMLCHFDEQAQAEVFEGNPDARLSGMFAPSGRAQPVDGGYRLSGRWPWSSGISHAEWMMVGGFIERDGPPQLHFFLLAPGEFEWEDTWYNAGLGGTGSHDTVIQDGFVPAHRVIPWEWVRDGTGLGAESNPGPIYRTPFVPPFFALLGMLALGAVRGAYEEFAEWSKTRASGVTGLKAAEHPVLHIGLTESAVEIDAAELLLNRCIDRSSNPDALDARMRVECKRDVAFSVQMLVRAMDRLQQLGGARGLFQSNSLQRTWRDLHTVAAHFTMNTQVAGELYGRLELGLEPPPRDPFF